MFQNLKKYANYESERDCIRKKSDDSLTFKMTNRLVNMKDMRVGQFDYDITQSIKSPIFYIRKKDKFSANFIFSALPEDKDDLVLVENEVVYV